MILYLGLGVDAAVLEVRKVIDNYLFIFRTTVSFTNDTRQYQYEDKCSKVTAFVSFVSYFS